MLILYDIVMHLYAFLIRAAAFASVPAALWISERRSNFESLERWKETETSPVFWVHCASHGEYEQGLPLIEEVRTRQPHLKIALTFFSPSGYKAVLHSAPVDWVGYIPADTHGEMSQFVETLDPSLVVFVKNEWWWNTLNILTKKQIPTHIISSTIRADHYFIKYPLGFVDKIVANLQSIGTVDDVSCDLMKRKYPSANVYVSGDLRVDRVLHLAKQSENVRLGSLLKTFRCIIYGSIWSHDTPIIELAVKRYPDHKHIIFPHKLDDDNVKLLSSALGSTLLSSEEDLNGNMILHVTEMGLLSKAYRYGDMAYVGGGYGVGVHNVLEAAVYGVPVLIGPNYFKSKEAIELIDCHIVTALPKVIKAENLPDLADQDFVERCNSLSEKYFNKYQGATEITYNHIFGKSQ